MSRTGIIVGICVDEGLMAGLARIEAILETGAPVAPRINWIHTEGSFLADPMTHGGDNPGRHRILVEADRVGSEFIAQHRTPIAVTSDSLAESETGLGMRHPGRALALQAEGALTAGMFRRLSEWELDSESLEFRMAVMEEVDAEFRRDPEGSGFREFREEHDLRRASSAEIRAAMAAAWWARTQWRLLEESEDGEEESPPEMDIRVDPEEIGEAVDAGKGVKGSPLYLRPDGGPA